MHTYIRYPFRISRMYDNISFSSNYRGIQQKLQQRPLQPIGTVSWCHDHAHKGKLSFLSRESRSLLSVSPSLYRARKFFDRWLPTDGRSYENDRVVKKSYGIVRGMLPTVTIISLTILLNKINRF
jgi:hypothetical protein